MQINHIHIGDNREVLKTFPDKSVNCCITSPPYFGLRDYGHEGQIGLEETPEQFVAQMVAVFREVRRVLRDDGVLWLNLGDSYAGGGMSNPSGKSTLVGGKDRGAADYSITRKSPNGLKPKDLIGIPWMVAFALRADGWYLRQDIIWHKPNPMPESVTDRCTKAHEYIFLLSKSERYWYDADAIAEKSKGITERIAPSDEPKRHGFATVRGSGVKRLGGDATRNRRSVWTVPTAPYSEAHFATYPPDLIRPCVLAGCPEGGVVLDPFFGSGTTGQVALEYGRKFVGIELNPEYARLAERRIRPALTQHQLFTPENLESR